MTSRIVQSVETSTEASFDDNGSAMRGFSVNNSTLSGEGSLLGAPTSPTSMSFENGDPLENLRLRLRNLGSECSKPNDAVMHRIKSIQEKHNNETDMDNLDRRSKSIQEALKQQIRKAKEACQHESNVLTDLATKLEALENRRKSLVHDIDSLDALHSDLQHRIALHKQEASQEIEEIDIVEEERKRQVPRLKTQISLYATTTGIKWEYSDDQEQSHILSGQVVSIDWICVGLSST